MGYSLNELFTALNERGLAFSRTSAGELQVTGDTSRLNDAIRQAIGEHRQTILSCLPQASPESPAIRTANAIRQQLDEFALWLQRFAFWAQESYLSSIDKRLAEAVDTQDLQSVGRQIEALRQEVEAINWAERILPHAFEAKAKHAAETGAGPAGSWNAGDEVPF
jgi:hypothetical protein